MLSVVATAVFKTAASNGTHKELNELMAALPSSSTTPSSLGVSSFLVQQLRDQVSLFVLCESETADKKKAALQVIWAISVLLEVLDDSETRDQPGDLLSRALERPVPPELLVSTVKTRQSLFSNYSLAAGQMKSIVSFIKDHRDHGLVNGNADALDQFLQSAIQALRQVFTVELDQLLLHSPQTGLKSPGRHLSPDTQFARHRQVVEELELTPELQRVHDTFVSFLELVSFLRSELAFTSSTTAVASAAASPALAPGTTSFQQLAEVHARFEDSVFWVSRLAELRANSLMVKRGHLSVCRVWAGALESWAHAASDAASVAAAETTALSVKKSKSQQHAKAGGNSKKSMKKSTSSAKRKSKLQQQQTQQQPRTACNDEVLDDDAAEESSAPRTTETFSSESIISTAHEASATSLDLLDEALLEPLTWTMKRSTYDIARVVDDDSNDGAKKGATVIVSKERPELLVPVFLKNCRIALRAICWEQGSFLLHDQSARQLLDDQEGDRRFVRDDPRTLVSVFEIVARCKASASTSGSRRVNAAALACLTPGGRALLMYLGQEVSIEICRVLDEYAGIRQVGDLRGINETLAYHGVRAVRLIERELWLMAACCAHADARIVANASVAVEMRISNGPSIDGKSADAAAAAVVLGDPELEALKTKLLALMDRARDQLMAEFLQFKQAILSLMNVVSSHSDQAKKMVEVEAQLVEAEILRVSENAVSGRKKLLSAELSFIENLHLPMDRQRELMAQVIDEPTVVGDKKKNPLDVVRLRGVELLNEFQAWSFQWLSVQLASFRQRELFAGSLDQLTTTLHVLSADLIASYQTLIDQEIATSLSVLSELLKRLSRSINSTGN